MFYYYLFASNFKNEDTTNAYSDSVRVTLPAQKIAISAYLVDGAPTLVENGFVMVRLNGVAKNIGVQVASDGIPTDEISYQWYEDEVKIDGAVSPTYTATQSGAYKVIVTNTYNTDTITDESYQFVVI